MNKIPNIISIRGFDVEKADIAFKNLMNLSEDYLNELTKRNHNLFKKSYGNELEEVALNALKEVSSRTPFRKENIVLVSGSRFPDIVAEKHYGVEVKSTKENTWRSTGSSIVENTRISDITRIYLLFGKLGGEFVEFKCRPYEDCLSNIAVTHSPRYLIDMELDNRNEKTIFEKIGVPYDKFRVMEENKKIEFLRGYYKERAKEKGKMSMPWWMGTENSTKVEISFFSDLSNEEKEFLKARKFILFPCVFQREYKPVALWLCNRRCYALT